MNDQLHRYVLLGGLLTCLGLSGCGQSDVNGSAETAVIVQTRAEPAAGKLSYNRDIRPILSDKCFACHGPDKAAREADLRLDMAEDGEGFWGGLSVIEPGDPEASELIRRVHSTRGSVVMPPPEFNVTLTDEEKTLLSRWIEQGAQYERHWAFVALPEQVAVPELNDDSWTRDEIDRFVLAKLEEQGLEPSAEASRERWLRRVSYDLTGLPPTPEEIEAFLADDQEGAYERVVDRLLDSPRYGERMAVPWLDLARYADTYGFSVDGLRDMWPWRDWLIRSFNENMPYDEFVTWQVAGDLLPDPTRDQQLATAFNRLHRMNAEGGAIREEWRNEYVADRLHTFGTAFLGMTFECARCHDHRYDPIDHREYYELFAFFNSIDESGTTEFQRGDIVPPPSMLLPNEAQAATYAALKEQAAEAEAAYAASLQERDEAFKAWASSDEPGLQVHGIIGHYPLEQIESGNRVANAANAEAPGSVAQDLSTTLPLIESGKVGQGVRLDGDNLVHLPGFDDLERWTPFTVAMWLKVDELEPGSPKVVAKRTSGTDVGPYGFDLMLDGGRLVARAYRSWPGNGIGVQTDAVVSADEWVHVVWRYDGTSRAEGLSLVMNGKLAEVEIVRDGSLVKTVGGGNPYGPGKHNLVLGHRFRDRGLAGGMVDEVHLLRRAVSDLEALALYDPEVLDRPLAQFEDELLRDFYLSAIDPQVSDARDAMLAAHRQLIEHENRIPEIAIMREMEQPRPAHVLARGLYDAERTEENRVIRDVPETIMPWPADAPRDRLGLAQWTVDPDQPLTARVQVNRLWQQCFGSGLVRSTDNFGLQGTWPTHPELLDYLARQYIDSGWDTKAMLKRIVLSATYRQDSATTSTQWRDDPKNDLLARGPARRLSAEMIRDTALFASGLLAEKQGGPPAYPYQPEGLWQEVNGAPYRLGSGDALYRRSLYTVWKRAVPAPNMMAFDTPTRETCSAQRAPTNTPLQALVLLNDVQYVEAARVLAQRVMLEAEGDRERVVAGFVMLTGRAPADREAEELLRLLDVQRDVFATGEADAAALLAMGKSPRDESLDAAEHAAMAVVMHAILNLDATIWRR